MNGIRIPAVNTPIASSASTAAFRLSTIRSHNGLADAPQCGQLGSATSPFTTNGCRHRRQLRVAEIVGETDDGTPDMASQSYASTPLHGFRKNGGRSAHFPSDERLVPISAMFLSDEQKTVIGMLHLLPLPGSPRYGGSFPDVLTAALRDADALATGGVHALMMENFNDVPFYPTRVPAHAVAAMTAIAAAVRQRFDL